MKPFVHLTVTLGLATALAGCMMLPRQTSTDLSSSAPPLITIPEPQAQQYPGEEVVMQALNLLKTRYRYGGKSLESGLDCSGFISHVFDQALGKSITGSAANMAQQGRRIARKDLKAGDLVFFNTLGRPRSHVGIYMGNGAFVHAANAKKGVRVDKMSNSYYAARFEEARTILR